MIPNFRMKLIFAALSLLLLGALPARAQCPPGSSPTYNVFTRNQDCTANAPVTFASPPVNPPTGAYYLFTDAASTGSCTGGGSALSICYWSGSSWTATSASTGTGIGDLGANGIYYRNGAGTGIPATASQMSGPPACADAGSNDTYACNLSPAIASYATGTLFWFKANTANTGAASINFNSKGALTIKKSVGGVTTDLNDNDIRAGQWVAVVYDGTNAQMVSALGNKTNVPIACGDLTDSSTGCAMSTTGAGDISGTLPNVTVATVGTSSAANIHSAELAANAATNANTVSTIVKRDSSGNFSAGTITANLTGTASIAATGDSATNFFPAGTLEVGLMPAVVMRTDQSNTITSGTQDDRLATHTLPVKTSTIGNIPATCTNGELYFSTSAVAGSNLYLCTDNANTWTPVTGGGGAGNVSGPSSATSGHFATYGDTSGKVLVDTLGLVTTVGPTGNDTSVPSEKAVRDAIAASVSGVASIDGKTGAITVTSPIHTTSNALDCPTCIVATAPGAGILHTAGSTQTATSSAIVNADITDATIATGKLANIASGTVLGRSAAGAGAVSALTTLPTAAVPAFTGGDVTSAGGSLNLSVGGVGGAAVPTSAALVATNASKQLTAVTTIPTSTVPAFTGGDVTSAGASLNLSIAANAVTLAKLANVAQATVLGRTDGAGTGGVGALTTIPTGTLPAFSGGDVTSSAGSTTLTIGAGKVTMADLANIATNSVIGRTAAGTGVPSAITSLPGSLMPAFTGGDVTSSAGAIALTLATVNSSPGSCGDSTHSCQITTNGKGLVTAQTPVAIPTTSGTSILIQKGNGSGGFTDAVTGVDFAPATSGNGTLLAPNGTGGTRNATQAEAMAVICSGTGCSTGTNVVTVAGNAIAAGGAAAAHIPVTQSGSSAVFTCSSNTINTFAITLTGTVSSSTLASCTAGMILNFEINVATGPYAFNYPSGFSLATQLTNAVNLTAAAVYKQAFEWNGTSAVPLGPAVSDSGPSLVIETAMPAGNPASGFAFCVDDSTQHGFYQCKDSSGNINSTVRVENASSNQWADGLLSTGHLHFSQPNVTNLGDYNNVLVTNQNRTLGAVLGAPGGDLLNGGVNAQTGTSYTIGAADENRLTTFTNASPVAVTLPDATAVGFGQGAFFHMTNLGAGRVTVSRSSTSTINGSTNVTLDQGQGMFLASDGVNFSAWISASPSGGNASTVNGGAIPASAPLLGSNSSNQIVLATPFATNAQNATYQVLASDFSSYKTIVVASGTFTITLVASGAQPATGQSIRVINYGSGVVTIARSGQNLNGGTTSLTLPAATAAVNSTSAFIVSDGTNYFATTNIPTATEIGLGSVTNDAQTKAAVVPNTAPTAGQILAGNAGGTAYAPVSMSQDCTMTSAGVITCTKSNNVSLGVFATATGATNSQTATYQALAADFTNLKQILVASGTFTITLVASGSQPAAGQYINIVNYGSGVVTVARSGQNINGGTTSLTIPAGSATAPASATVISDGTNYFASVLVPPALANITGLGTGVGTFLGTPSGANLASALTTALPNTKGGTGQDTSASTGVPQVASGTWSVSTTLPSGLSATNMTLTTPALGTPSALNLTNATALPAAQVPSVLTTVGTSRTTANPAEIVICTTTCTVTPQAPAAGVQLCIQNDDNISTVITVAAVSTVQYEATARTSYGTANHTMTSGGAVGDQICFVGRDSTHYNVFSSKGTWTNN